MTASVLKAEMLKFPQIESNTKQCIVSAQDRPHEYLRRAATIVQ